MKNVFVFIKKQTIAFIAVVFLILAGCSTGATGVLENPGQIRPSAGTVQSSTEDFRNMRNSYIDELSEAGREYSVEDLFDFALRNNQEIQSAHSKYKAAAERPQQARSLPDPRLSLQADDSLKSREIALTQTFPWFGKRDLRGMAEENAALAEYNRYEAVQFEVLSRVRDAYSEYYYLSKMIEITKENLEIMEFFRDVVRTRFEVGEETYADMVRIEIETEKLRDRLEELQEQRRPRRAALNRELGRPPSAPLPWYPVLPEESAAGFEGVNILGIVMQNNPRLLAQRFEIDRRSEQKSLAKKEYYPDLTVGIMRMDEGMGGMAEGINAAMISINIPIWKDSYRAGVRGQRELIEAEHHTLVYNEYLVESELENSLFSFRDAQRKIRLYEDHLLPRAEESLGASETAYRAGNIDVLGWLDAQRKMLSFELEIERARVERFKAIGEIEKLAGKRIDEFNN